MQLPNGTSHSNAESYLHEAESSALAGLEPGARSALASAEKLGGSWGPQLFSLADAGVLMRLEALPGVEKCDMYCPTEYRGGWEAVRRGLEREVQRHQKAAKVLSWLTMMSRTVAGEVASSAVLVGIRHGEMFAAVLLSCV